MHLGDEKKRQQDLVRRSSNHASQTSLIRRSFDGSQPMESPECVGTSSRELMYIKEENKNLKKSFQEQIAKKEEDLIKLNELVGRYKEDLKRYSDNADKMSK